MEQDRFIAAFDSASAMARALARCLDGRDFFGLGVTPGAARALGPLVNGLPRRVRRGLYACSGALEGVPPERLGELRGDRLGRWAAGVYPERRYPAAFVGSSNGAVAHLAAALGAPWLPQTFLIPVRRRVRPGDARADLAWGERAGRELVAANPDLQLHHMHDPNQDELMVRRMAYFRVKLRRLPPSYREFLERNLALGAPIGIVDCERRWPVTRVAERHVFQCGAVGGLAEEDYPARWDCPPADGAAPEAEWGFEPSLREDLEAFAEERGHPVFRIAFREPEDVSEEVADLHRWWLERRGVEARRLLVESFILLEPELALRSGAVPFWLTFNTQGSADRLERHLDAHAYDQIVMTLFSHGADSAGLAPVERWRAAVGRARGAGRLAGVDEGRYPQDFAVYVRFTDALRRAGWPDVPRRPLALGELAAFLGERGARAGVTWSGAEPAARPALERVW